MSLFNVSSGAIACLPAVDCRSYLFSVPYWLCEFAGFVLSNAFVISLWNQIDRPKRRIADMLAAPQLPAVDVYIATYSGERSLQAGHCAAFESPLSGDAQAACL
jgi:hypothetical protein